MVDKYARKRLEPLLNILAKPFLKVHPNILSLIGMISPITFFFFVYYGHHYLGLLALLAGAFDAIDGTVSRLSGKESKFGFLLDSSLDRIADGIFIATMGWANIVNWWQVAPTMIASFMVSFIRSRTELAAGNDSNLKKFKLNSGLMGRAERTILIFLSVLLFELFPHYSFNGFNIAEIVFMILLFLTMFTVIQRYVEAYKHLQ